MKILQDRRKRRGILHPPNLFVSLESLLLSFLLRHLTSSSFLREARIRGRCGAGTPAG